MRLPALLCGFSALVLLACGGKAGDSGTGTDAGADSTSDGTPSDTASDTGTVDGPSDTAEGCFDDAGTVPSVPFKQCGGDGDCVVVQHQTDCCGTIVLMGVAKSKSSAFSTCETAWQKHFPPCGCAPGPTKTEDGKTPTDPGKAVVKCTDFTSGGGICKTSSP